MMVLLAVSVLTSFSSVHIPQVSAAALTVTLNPFKGAPPVAAFGSAPSAPGQTVFVTATGASRDVGTSCGLSASIPNLLSSATASVVAPGVVSGSFVVGSVPASSVGNQTYQVYVRCPSTGTPTDFGFTNFQVVPRVTIGPAIGTAGQTISLSGSGFRADATACNIQSNSTHGVVLNPTCSVSSGVMTGQFTVNSTLDGFYNISILPNQISNVSGFAYFRKVSTPTIDVSPNSAPPGYGTLDGAVAVSGGGFPTGSSRSCRLSAYGGAVLFATSPSPTCTISTAGTVTGSFGVSLNAAANVSVQFTINVTDTATPFFAASASFVVLPKPLINFNVTSARIGQAVNVSIPNVSPYLNRFSQFDVGPCTISSSPSGLFSISSCFIRDAGSDGAGFLTAYFVVATNNPATYTVTVTPIHGDQASNIFSPAGGPTVVVDPSVSPPSPPPPSPPRFLSVTGRGFNLADTSCLIRITGNSTPVATGSPSCSIASGNVNGAFQVSQNAAPGAYQVNVTGLPNADMGFGIFEIGIPAIFNTTTTVFSPTSTVSTATTTFTTTTATSTSFSTTTFQTTGRSTESYTTYTTTTLFGQTTSTITTTAILTSTISTTSTAVTTLSTTTTQILGQVVRSLGKETYLDGLGVLGALVLLIPFIVRRFEE